MEGNPKTEKDSFFSIIFYPTGFALTGLLGSVFSNYSSRRPLYSAMHRHVIYGLTGAVLGYYADLYLKKKWAHRDAIIKHYVELHPEDFLDTKKKYKEIFEEWKPIR